MSEKSRALPGAAVAAVSRSGYPEPYRSRVLPRAVRGLGDAFGLTRIGINLVTIEPGKESSMRHWHTREDEFVYVVAGTLVLRTDAGEEQLEAGMCAGFPAGARDGHQLINRSASPATFLVVSNRDPEDTAHYSDPDVDLMWSPPNARGRMTRRDGTPC
ncbi:MAG: cupin domain-containing protein [Proteobacteria bacterium]|nr:cupin domain-containing protein [Pseudomonadota bacterium]